MLPVGSALLGPPAGLFSSQDHYYVASEPTIKRSIAFIDGQNLFYAATHAFGYDYPNYDPFRLAERVCDSNGWTVTDVHFYTGIPEKRDNPFWNHFWVGKLAVMGTRGVKTFARPLRYRDQEVVLPDGVLTTTRIGQEKGIDVRLALDVVRLALDQSFDVAVIFSQDQDLREMVDEVKRIAEQQNRWIKVACAFPHGGTYSNRRGIDKTDWIRIDRPTYDSCLDLNDYRPKRFRS